MPVLRVRFYQIDIGENGDGAGATWRFRTFVNGAEQQWNPANTKDNSSYGLNIDYPNVAVANTGTLKIDTGGYEEDGLLEANPPINSVNRSHSAADNWGVGDNAAAGSGGDGITYTIRYQVELKAPVVMKFDSAQALIEDFLDRGRRRAENKRTAATRGPGSTTDALDKIRVEAFEDADAVLARLERLASMPIASQVEEVQRAYARRGARVLSSDGAALTPTELKPGTAIHVILD